MVAAAGCGDGRPSTDARDSAGDKNADGSSNDRRDTGGSDASGTGGSLGGSGGAAGATGGTGGVAGTGGGAGTGGSAGTGGGSAGNDGGAGTDGGNPDGAAPSCSDGIKNSDETGIDCGGHCGKCAPGGPCLVNSDCQFSCRADKTCADCNVATDCTGVETECVHRSCTAGVCGSSKDPAGTALTVQTSGDCKKRQCAADGSVTNANDDTDVPDDRNPCTNDICTSGTPSHTMMPANTNCGGANHCNATGQCIGCTVAADCPGTDTACRTRTCTTGGVCGFSNAASGTKLVDPTAGDCKGLQCDGDGNQQVVNDNADLPVDNNVCTTDECTAGTPSHRPVASGMTCGTGLVCDGASHCVTCLSATTCPGTDAECHTRSCVDGACGVANMAAGTLVAAQTPRDCRKNVCNGQGGVVTVNDDLDLPVDSNVCTFDVCTAGTPSNPNVPAGNACGTSTICDGQGACVTCLTASSCPGTDTECHHRTCTAGVCGIANTAAGTPLATQVAGDCKRNQCDGTGAAVVVNDDADKPVDGNTCTDDVCTAGVPSNPNIPQGTTCGTSLICNGQGACVGCVTAADCGTNTFCQARTCSAAGVCGVNNTAAGTALPTQTAGDCKKVQCDGQGQPVTVNDDTDPLVDGNSCTKDQCMNGIVSNPPEDAGTTCNQNNGNRCNGSGTAPACVQCLQDSDCGTNTECRTFTCSGGQCVTNNAAQGTATSNQTAGDCKKNVCNGLGAIASANDDNDVHVDGNPCTSDVCMGGVATNPLVNVGTSCGPSLMCDAQGACVGCLTETDCPLPANACQTRVCKTGGVCGFDNLAQGTPVTDISIGDCHHNECDGNGQITAVIDDDDRPVTTNQCVTPTCTAGVPSFPPQAARFQCSQDGGTECDGQGACVSCIDASECPALPDGDTFCQHRTCTNGVCGIARPDTGTPTPDADQTPNNCKQQVCDGAGNAVDMPDDSDLPAANQCATPTCAAGVASSPPKPHGTACTQNGGLSCDGAGSCLATFYVVRVGDGSAALTNASTATFLEERKISNGDLVGSAIAFPTANSGANFALAVSGTASSEGGLSLSGDGRYLVLGGYNSAPGVASIAGTSSATVNRVIARVSADGTVDTSTRMNTALSGDNFRGATSQDGSVFWAGGNSSTTAGGVWSVALGSSGAATQILAAPNSCRGPRVFGGQLYASASSGTFRNVFAIGSGLPTTAGQTATALPGLPTATASPNSFVLLDRDSNVTGFDTLYWADDGGSSVQGIEKWTLATTGGTWTKVATFNLSTAIGFRGLDAVVTGSNVTLVATTSDAATRIVVFVDDGTASPTGNVIGTSPTNMVYRGIAFPPHP